MLRIDAIERGRTMFAALRNTVLGLLLVAAMLAGSGVSRATSGAQTIVGDYETTNPIYPMIGADVGVVLYDLAGEIWRDYAFVRSEERRVGKECRSGRAPVKYRRR